MSLYRSPLSKRLAWTWTGGIRAPTLSCPRYIRSSASQQYAESSVTAKPSDPPGDSNVTESSLVRREGSSEGLPRHQPDYDAPIDHGTSTFSPIPRRVMDGSEPGEITAAAVLSGAPIDLQARTVRIYRPAKTAMQSGTWHSHHWRMDWDPLQKGHRWENPLMGWQSSADAMQGTHLNFTTKEDAITFANKQGYEYFVQEPTGRKFVPKAYANNFVHDKGIESTTQDTDVVGTHRIKHIKTK